jgi:hypothetical protein
LGEALGFAGCLVDQVLGGAVDGGGSLQERRLGDLHAVYQAFDLAGVAPVSGRRGWWLRRRLRAGAGAAGGGFRAGAWGPGGCVDRAGRVVEDEFLQDGGCALAGCDGQPVGG